ncbi:MAG: PaaI family thioesterase [Deferrisomatales bacterium]
MPDRAIQEHYPDHLSHCYGCGRLNERGLQLRSYWREGEAVAVFTPEPHHTALPGFVYGGLLASLVDCHGTATAAAAAYHAEGRALGSEPPLRYVTGSLQVRFLRPTPLGVPLELRGRARELKGRKVVVQVTVSARGEACVEGEVVGVQMPEGMAPR